ncbi:MAG: hypothetical protein WKH47_00075 [Actinomycetes bacterium]
MKRTTSTSLAIGAAATSLVLAGCGADTPQAGSTGNPAPSTSTTETASEENKNYVDLAPPVFSDPTNITNPLFPISELDQVIQLGDVAGTRLRFEITRLPETKTIEWDGQSVETVQSQLVGYGDGRVLEVATDFFAQDDGGAVWYFGEQVDNYEDGVIADNDGTWIAGKDGPPGMIMPADPQVGDKYRPENIPDLVFEEVTVLKTDQTVPGPRGDVKGAIVVQEMLMDGSTEGKTFAPAYGEFQAVVESEQELVEMGLAVPADFLGGPAPAELTAMSAGGDALRAAASTGDFDSVSASLDDLRSAWGTLRGDTTPPFVADQIDAALAAVDAAIGASDAGAAAQASIDLAHASLDLQLQHLSVPEVDLARFRLWVVQLRLDTATEDQALIAGDAAILETIWLRVGHTVDAASAGAVSGQLDDLRTAADAGDSAAAAAAATALMDALAS